MQPDKIGDPIAQDRPHELRRHLGMELVSVRRHHMTDVVDQPRQLELLVVGMRPAQDFGRLKAVVEEVVVQPRNDGQIICRSRP
jgi:hypothetical protein